MTKRKIERTDKSHLMTHPEGRGKVIVVRFLLGILGLLSLALLFSQFFPDFGSSVQGPETKRETSAPNGSQSKSRKEASPPVSSSQSKPKEEGKAADKPKTTEIHNEDAEFKWEDKDFQALEINKTTSEEVIASFGKASIVQETEEGLTLLYQDQPAISRYNPQETVTLGFDKKDGSFILISKSSKNLTRPYENNKTDEGEPVWTKEDYQQLTVSSPSGDQKGLTYDQVYEKYGIPYGIDFLEQHSPTESKRTIDVWYFHPTKPGDDSPNPYVTVDLVFEQDQDGIYYLVEKSSFDYD